MDGTTMDPGTAARGLVSCYLLSLRRMLFSRFTLANLLLIFMPVALAVLIVSVARRPLSDETANFIAENFLRFVYLHFVVFFAANLIGFSMMRHDAEERTLHFLLLQPISRWSVAVARLASFLTLTVVFCCVSFWLMYFIFAIKAGGMAGLSSQLFDNGRLHILERESLVLVLGLVVYGSFAMMMSSFLKTALYALILLGWESALPYLPSTLKDLTIMHYLQSLLPAGAFDEPRGLLEIMGSPAGTGQSVAVLISAAVVFFLIGAWFFTQLECVYGEG